MCGADGPGCAEEVEVVHPIQPRGKGYLHFGGKAPRSAAPATQDEQGPADNGEGAGESKQGQEEQPQALTPPHQQPRALLTTVRETRRSKTRLKRTARKSSLPLGQPAPDPDATLDHTDLELPELSESSESTGFNETVQAGIIASLELQVAQRDITIEEQNKENITVRDENYLLHEKIYELEGKNGELRKLLAPGTGGETGREAREAIYREARRVQKRYRGLSAAALRDLLKPTRETLSQQAQAAANFCKTIDGIIDDLLRTIRRPDHPGSPEPKK